MVLYLEEMNTWKGICETGKVARCFSYPGRATQRGIVSLCSLLNYERQECFVALRGSFAWKLCLRLHVLVGKIGDPSPSLKLPAPGAGTTPWEVNCNFVTTVDVDYDQLIKQAWKVCISKTTKQRYVSDITCHRSQRRINTPRWWRKSDTDTFTKVSIANDETLQHA